MNRVRGMASLLCVLTIAARCWAGDPIPAGNYKLSTFGPNMEFAVCILKLETKEGKLAGAMTASNPQVPLQLVSVTQDGKKIRVVVKNRAVEQTFEGQLPASESNTIRGVMVNPNAVQPAQLVPTDQTEWVARQMNRSLGIEPMQKALTLSSRPLLLNMQASREKDAEKKADLQRQAKEVSDQAQRELPELYREVLDKHSDTPAVIDATINLLRGAVKSNLTPPLAAEYASKADKFAAQFGARMQADVRVRLAEAAVNQPGLAPVALDYALRVEKELSAEHSIESQIRVLQVLASAQRKLGRTKQAATIDNRLAKLEVDRDKEYLASMPPFKPTPFEGRKAKSDRVVVMELFTGAQCPPCVAADVAFDALEKTYKPKDIVLIQYHMHIPGPDPLTNADSESRWAYYRKQYPMAVRGTPCTIFNGNPLSGGGGGMAAAEKKYGDYRDIIDDLLEKEASMKLSAAPVRSGDKIEMKVNAGNVTDFEDLKLRVVLLEESVRYVGNNKLRFHHHVVRHFPGGVAGIALTAKESSHLVKVDLANLRTNLNKYLDEFAVKRAFPHPDRPMEFKHLKLIAFVQNDKTLEILQAVQADVPEESAKTAQK